MLALEEDPTVVVVIELLELELVGKSDTLTTSTESTLIVVELKQLASFNSGTRDRSSVKMMSAHWGHGIGQYSMLSEEKGKSYVELARAMLRSLDHLDRSKIATLHRYPSR